MDWERPGKAKNLRLLVMLSCLSLHHFEQFETFTFDPLIGDNLARVRVTVGRLRCKVVAIVPVLTNGPLSGAKGHDAGGSELYLISHVKPLQSVARCDVLGGQA